MTRLVAVTPKPAFEVTCMRCGHKGFSDAEEWFADLQGPAFKAYYCNKGCADWQRQSKGAKLLQEYSRRHPENVVWTPETGWKA